MTTERKCYHCDKPTTNELVCDDCKPKSAMRDDALIVMCDPANYITPQQVLEAFGEAMEPPSVQTTNELMASFFSRPDTMVQCQLAGCRCHGRPA